MTPSGPPSALTSRRWGRTLTVTALVFFINLSVHVPRGGLDLFVFFLYKISMFIRPMTYHDIQITKYIDRLLSVISVISVINPSFAIFIASRQTTQNEYSPLATTSYSNKPPTHPPFNRPLPLSFEKQSSISFAKMMRFKQKIFLDSNFYYYSYF